jgi:heme oxygenase
MKMLIYPPELEVKETIDDFNFKIIHFPNMSSNIPASPAYGVYISQLIRYARASS